MFITLDIHPRIGTRHPEITDADIRHAWENAIVIRERIGSEPLTLMAAGPDCAGRLLEVLVVERDGGNLLVYHAMGLTRKAARELELS